MDMVTLLRKLFLSSEQMQHLSESRLPLGWNVTPVPSSCLTRVHWQLAVPRHVVCAQCFVSAPHSPYQVVLSSPQTSMPLDARLDFSFIFMAQVPTTVPDKYCWVSSHWVLQGNEVINPWEAMKELQSFRQGMDLLPSFLLYPTVPSAALSRQKYLINTDSSTDASASQKTNEPYIYSYIGWVVNSVFPSWSQF